MIPSKLSVQQIFEKERRYVVPLYQRAYVWNRDDQWEPLWDDIIRQATHCYKDPETKFEKTHFLGAVVLNVSKIVGDSVASSEVIDGQQRLTTLQLLIAAIRDYAETVDTKIANKFRRLARNPDQELDSEELFKVWPTNSDRVVFSKVMTALSPAEVRIACQSGNDSDASLPRMAEAYLYFYDAVQAFAETAKDDADKEAKLQAIFQALRIALQIIVIELEASDDPQVIFETLNARGQPLLPSDLIRNFVFLQASNVKGTHTDKLYDSYWRPFDDLRLPEPDANGEDRFWHVMERQGRLMRPRIDLFIFHYLVLKTETDLNIGRLFREFREWRDSNPTTAEEFLAELKTFSGFFKSLVAPEGQSRLAKFASRLKSLDTSTVYPTLLFLMSLPKDQLSAADLDRCLIDLESWLVRRFVCQYTNKNYNRFFLSLLVKLKKVSRENAELAQSEGVEDKKFPSIADALRVELQRSGEATAIWPSDADFEKSWLSKPIYVKSRIDRCAMVLRALEEAMRTSKTESSVLQGKLTVEHILPQKGSLGDYPYSEEMPAFDGETVEQTRLRILHTVGNLTLLTQELNSSVSNGPYPEKRAEIIEHSDLRLNAWMRKNEKQEWSEADILDRGATLFAYAKDFWPLPTEAKVAVSGKASA